MGSDKPVPAWLQRLVAVVFALIVSLKFIVTAVGVLFMGLLVVFAFL